MLKWIDASDFRIVRLRTDLLAPQPAVRLQKRTTEVDFTEVRVPHVASPLWLPRRAKVEWQSAASPTPGGELLNISPQPAVTLRGVEEHAYSNYHAYEVAARINPALSDR